MSLPVVTVRDLQDAQSGARRECFSLSLDSLVRAGEVARPDGASSALVERLRLGSGRLVSVAGALNWMACNLNRIGQRRRRQLSGNFAAGIAFAGMRYQSVSSWSCPTPRSKFDLARLSAPKSVPITSPATTNRRRDWLTREIAETEGAVLASPYDDPHVIAGNGLEGWGSSVSCGAKGGTSRTFSARWAAAGSWRGTRWPLGTDSLTPGSSAWSRKEPTISADRWPRESASVSNDPRASATVCCRMTWASTIGRSFSGTLPRR